MKFRQSSHFILFSLILISFLIDFILCQKNSTKKQREKGSKKKYESTKDSAPPYTFAAWNERNRICLLVKLDAMFIITYDTSYGKQQLIHRLPIDSEMKGRCANVLDANSIMDITWKGGSKRSEGGFMLRLVFEKYRDSDTWSVKRMEFVYNTGDALFDGASRASERIAKITNENVLAQFETPLGKSYLCPSPDVLNFVDSETGESNVIVRLSNVQMQAFDITAGKFSPVLRCGQVGFGYGVVTPFGLEAGDSDGVQMTVFTITVMSSLSTVLGYALYRSFFVKKIDYEDTII